MSRTPAVYLRDGDIVEVRIDPIGVLRNRVRCE
jgi:2-keto-4-pentenoate hydratase/2-oxohepta-3-ene-1,7-dioic acid hydratase in catechol pathway